MYGPDGLGKTAKGGHPRRLAVARAEPDLAQGAATDARPDTGAEQGRAGSTRAASAGSSVETTLEASGWEHGGARGVLAEGSLGEDPRVAGARARRGALLREVGAGLDRAAAGGSRGNLGTLARARTEGDDRGSAAGAGAADAAAAASDADTAERTAATYAGGAAGGAEDSANCIRDYNPILAAEYQEACYCPCLPPCTFASVHLP